MKNSVDEKIQKQKQKSEKQVNENGPPFLHTKNLQVHWKQGAKCIHTKQKE